MAKNEKIVTIFGTSKAWPGDEVFETARTMGKELAEKGCTIANGGYGGTMLASAKAARVAGGKVIGVTCSAFKKSSANEYITQEIVTDSLQQRLAKLIELGNAYVVLAGGTGTLLELAHVWELKNKGFTRTAKPIIIVGRFWKELVDLIARADAESVRCLDFAAEPRDVAGILDNFLEI